MSFYHAIYNKGGDTPTPEPTTKLIYLGTISNTLDITPVAESANLDTTTLKTENFLLVPNSWIINASGGSRVNEKKEESGSNNGTYSINYNTETATLTISNQPNCNLNGEQAFARSNAIVTFKAYYLTGEVNQ